MTLRRAVSLLILLCLLALPVVVTEFVLRQSGLGTPIRYGTNAAFRYAPLPEQQVERWGAAVTIDAHGLRGTEPWSTLSDLHVLFVGDSVTWGGTHMDDAALFSSLVCDELEAQLRRRVVCGNAGVNNYGTDNMRARLRHDRDVVRRADAVVVTIVAEDTRRGLTDLQGRYYYSSIPPGPLPAIGEALGFLLYRASGYIRHHDLRYDDAYDIDVGLESLNLLLAELAALGDAGKTTLLVYSPTLRDLEEPPPSLGRAVRARITQSQVPSLDLVDAIRHLDPSQDVRAADLYEDGMHLTAVGHRLYGSWIAAALVDALAQARTFARKANVLASPRVRAGIAPGAAPAAAGFTGHVPHPHRWAAQDPAPSSSTSPVALSAIAPHRAHRRKLDHQNSVIESWNFQPTVDSR